MSLRTLLLGLAVAVCALWPQGLVLCVGGEGRVELEPGVAPCGPVDDDGAGDEHENCDDCRHYEGPELASATPPPALPAPLAAAGPDDFIPDAAPASAPAADGRPPLRGPDELRSVILVV